MSHPVLQPGPVASHPFHPQQFMSLLLSSPSSPYPVHPMSLQAPQVHVPSSPPNVLSLIKSTSCLCCHKQCSCQLQKSTSGPQMFSPASQIHDLSIPHQPMSLSQHPCQPMAPLLTTPTLRSRLCPGETNPSGTILSLGLARSSHPVGLCRGWAPPEPSPQSSHLSWARRSRWC